MAAERITRRPRFVTETQFHAGRREFFDDFVQVFELAANRPVMTDLARFRRRNGDGHTFLVDIQAEVMNNSAHGCLVPFNWFVIAVENIGPDQTGG